MQKLDKGKIYSYAAVEPAQALTVMVVLKIRNIFIKIAVRCVFGKLLLPINITFNLT